MGEWGLGRGSVGDEGGAEDELWDGNGHTLSS